MAKIALELVRGGDGGVINIHAIQPGTIFKYEENPNFYAQVIDGKIVTLIPIRNVLIAEVYND